MGQSLSEAGQKTDVGDRAVIGGAAVAYQVVTVGSSVEPGRHVPWLVGRVMRTFGEVVLSRFAMTEAEGMAPDASSRVVNGALLVRTALASAELASLLKEWEEASGRPLGMPGRKVADRTLDLDLAVDCRLYAEGLRWEEGCALPTEGYRRPFVEDLLSFFDTEGAVAPVIGDLWLFHWGRIPLGGQVVRLVMEGD